MHSLDVMTYEIGLMAPSSELQHVKKYIFFLPFSDT
jgi:hypothetical protein